MMVGEKLNIKDCPIIASYDNGVSNTTNSKFILIWLGADPTSTVSLINQLAVVGAPLSPRTILEYGHRKLVGMPIHLRMLIALLESIRTFGMVTPTKGIEITKTWGKGMGQPLFCQRTVGHLLVS